MNLVHLELVFRMQVGSMFIVDLKFGTKKIIHVGGGNFNAYPVTIVSTWYLSMIYPEIPKIIIGFHSRTCVGRREERVRVNPTIATTFAV